MRIIDRLRAFLNGPAPSPILAPRHERRDAARERHRESDEPLWSADDAHLGEPGESWIADVTPGTPGHFGSVRTHRDD